MSLCTSNLAGDQALCTPNLASAKAVLLSRKLSSLSKSFEHSQFHAALPHSPETLTPSTTTLPSGFPNDFAAVSARLSPRAFATLDMVITSESSNRNTWLAATSATVCKPSAPCQTQEAWDLLEKRRPAGVLDFGQPGNSLHHILASHHFPDDQVRGVQNRCRAEGYSKTSAVRAGRSPHLLDFYELALVSHQLLFYVTAIKHISQHQGLDLLQFHQSRSTHTHTDPLKLTAAPV